jgi:molybdate transport system permease protein
MTRPVRARTGRITAASLSALLLALLLLPVMALAVSSSPAELLAGARHPLFATALWLSLRTSLLSLLLVVLCGTPLAFWLARRDTPPARAVSLAVDLPIVLPPAVVGVALLQTFGRRGLLGPALDSIGITLPFTSAAVVLAQVVVSAPFYVQSAANAFRKVDPDLLLVARTLGASPAGAFARVAVPLALPGLVAGASLAWARALGEFGATLLFAGNLAGTTRTLPLAIYTALESDLRAAVAISLVLAGVALVLLLGLRAAPDLLARGSR